MTENTATTAPEIQPGVWGKRPGYTQDTFAHNNAAGDENLTVVFSHDTETAVPTLRMNGAAAVRVVINGRTLPNPSEAEIETLRGELAEVADAAEGDSNDEEIEVLQAALDTALGLLGMTRG
jgi:hypothetical protein